MDKLLEGTVYTCWYEMICPYCKTHCMINVGDPSDYCGSDPESVRCYSCEKVFLMLGTQDYINNCGDEEIETEEDLNMDPWDSESVRYNNELYNIKK